MEGIFYTGVINLSKIPKELIKKNRNGESIIYADFSERRSPSAYGDTHYLKLYDSTNRQQIYIGDFRPSNFSKNASDNRESDNRIPPGGGFQGRDGKWHPIKDLYTDADKPAPTPAPAPEPLDPQDGDLPF